MVWSSVLGRKGGKLLFCSFYRPLDGIERIQELAESLEIIRKKMRDPVIVIGGDFHLPRIDWVKLSNSYSGREKNISQTLIHTFSLHALD